MSEEQEGQFPLGHIYDHERLSFFIDGPNFHGTARDMGFNPDYSEIRKKFAEVSVLRQCLYYTAIDESGDHSPLKPLVDYLSYNGYIVRTKPMKEYRDSGHSRIKGNMDVDLAVDMLQAADHLDHVVLFSGDGDFRRLVEAVQNKGVVVTVISDRSVVSDDLCRQADVFVRISDIKPLIQRHTDSRPEEEEDQV